MANKARVLKLEEIITIRLKIVNQYCPRRYFTTNANPDAD